MIAMKKIKPRKKILIYKIVAIVLAIAAAFSINSFSNTQDVNQRSIVTMMGIDKHESGGVVVSAHMLVATPGVMANEFRQDMSSSYGANIFEALSKFNVAKGRKVEFGQCGLVVFGKDILKDGILEIATGLLSSNIVSGGVLMLATDGTACEFLTQASELGEMTSEHIAKFLTRFQHTLEMPMSVLLSYLNSEFSESGASIIPVVKFKDSKEDCEQIEPIENSMDNTNEGESFDEQEAQTDNTQEVENEGGNENESEDSDAESQEDKPSDAQEVENQEENHDEQSEETEEENSEDKESGEEPADENEEEQNDEEEQGEEAQIDISSINTSAVLKGGKLVGYLNAQETLGYTLIQNQSKRGTLSIDGFEFNGEQFGAVFSQVRRKSVRTKTSFVDGIPTIKYDLNVYLDITTTHEFMFKINLGQANKNDIYSEIEHAFSQSIKNDINSTIEKLKELNADFLGIKARLFRTDNRDMHEFMLNNADNFFDKLNVVVNVKVKAR